MLIELTKVLWILKYAMKFYKNLQNLQNLQNFMCFGISYKPQFYQYYIKSLYVVTIWRMFRRFASGVLPWKGLFSGIKDVPSKLRWPCWHCNAHTQRVSQSQCYKVLHTMGFLSLGHFKCQQSTTVRQWAGKLNMAFYNNFSKF